MRVTWELYICDLADRFQQQYCVNKVIISQISFREALPYEIFNGHVVSANKELKELTKEIQCFLLETQGCVEAGQQHL